MFGINITASKWIYSGEQPNVFRKKCEFAQRCDDKLLHLLVDKSSIAKIEQRFSTFENILSTPSNDAAGDKEALGGRDPR